VLTLLCGYGAQSEDREHWPVIVMCWRKSRTLAK